MLTNEDKTAYLSICTMRRRVRRHLARVETIRRNNEARKQTNIDAMTQFQADTKDFFKQPVVNLDDYRFHLSMLNDTLDLYKANLFLDAKAQPLLARLKKSETKVEAMFKEAQQALRSALKGRGKVLSFEGQRS